MDAEAWLGAETPRQVRRPSCQPGPKSSRWPRQSFELEGQCHPGPEAASGLGLGTPPRRTRRASCPFMPVPCLPVCRVGLRGLAAPMSTGGGGGRGPATWTTHVHVGAAHDCFKSSRAPWAACYLSLVCAISPPWGPSTRVCSWKSNKRNATNHACMHPSIHVCNTYMHTYTRTHAHAHKHPFSCELSLGSLSYSRSTLPGDSFPHYE